MISTYELRSLHDYLGRLLKDEMFLDFRGYRRGDFTRQDIEGLCEDIKHEIDNRLKGKGTQERISAK